MNWRRNYGPYVLALGLTVGTDVFRQIQRLKFEPDGNDAAYRHHQTIDLRATMLISGTVISGSLASFTFLASITQA